MLHIHTHTPAPNNQLNSIMVNIFPQVRVFEEPDITVGSGEGWGVKSSHFCGSDRNKGKYKTGRSLKFTFSFTQPPRTYVMDELI